MRHTYDVQAEAVYVYLTGERVATTVGVTEWINVDLDGEGRPVGVEVLNVAWPASEDTFRAATTQRGMTGGER